MSLIITGTYGTTPTSDQSVNVSDNGGSPIPVEVSGFTPGDIVGFRMKTGSKGLIQTTTATANGAGIASSGWSVTSALDLTALGGRDTIQVQRNGGAWQDLIYLRSLQIFLLQSQNTDDVIPGQQYPINITALDGNGNPINLTDTTWSIDNAISYIESTVPSNVLDYSGGYLTPPSGGVFAKTVGSPGNVVKVTPNLDPNSLQSGSHVVAGLGDVVTPAWVTTDSHWDGTNLVIAQDEGQIDVTYKYTKASDHSFNPGDVPLQAVKTDTGGVLSAATWQDFSSFGYTYVISAGAALLRLTPGNRGTCSIDVGPVISFDPYKVTIPVKVIYGNPNNVASLQYQGAWNGAFTVHVGFCPSSNQYSTKYRIAYAISTDNGVSWGTATIEDVSLVTPDSQCAIDGNANPICQNVYNIGGLTPGANRVLGINMQFYNPENPGIRWDASWDGDVNNFVPYSQINLYP